MPGLKKRHKQLRALNRQRAIQRDPLPPSSTVITTSDTDSDSCSDAVTDTLSDESSESDGPNEPPMALCPAIRAASAPLHRYNALGSRRPTTYVSKSTLHSTSHALYPLSAQETYSAARRRGVIVSRSTFNRKRALIPPDGGILKYLQSEAEAVVPPAPRSPSRSPSIEEVPALSSKNLLPLASPPGPVEQPTPSPPTHTASAAATAAGRARKQAIEQRQADRVAEDPYNTKLRVSIIKLDERWRRAKANGRGISPDLIEQRNQIVAFHQQYLECLRVNRRAPAQTASLAVAQMLSPRLDAQLHTLVGATAAYTTNGSYRAQRIRDRARYLANTGELMVKRVMKNRGKASQLENPAVQAWLARAAACYDNGALDIPGLLVAFNNATFSGSLDAQPISRRALLRWVKKLGYRRIVASKGVYHDGHEREDVVRYRQEVYLPAVARLSETSRSWTKDPHGSWTEHPPSNTGATETVLIFHDESAFHTQEMARIVWSRGNGNGLRQKGAGSLMMVSDFILATTGRLVIPEDQRHGRSPAQYDARRIIEPRAGGAAYWNLPQLEEQLLVAIDIFEVTHPGKRAIFVFDCSSAHESYAADALRITQMNLGPGGRKPRMHDTFIPTNDNAIPVHLRGQWQPMIFPPGHELAGQPKGVRQVLQERGLWDYWSARAAREGRGPLKLSCNVCSGALGRALIHERRERELLATMDPGYEPAQSTRTITQPAAGCCWSAILSNQADFLNERPRLEQMLEKAGHQALFLPKFHCELNPIELYWSQCKLQYRESAGNHKRSMAEARVALINALNGAAKLEHIRAWINRCSRYCSAYTNGLDAIQTERAVRKYRSHRTIPQSAIMDVDLLVHAELA